MRREPSVNEVAPSEPTAAGERSGARTMLRRAAGHALAVFLAVRLGLALVAFAAVALLPPLDPVGPPGWPPPPGEPGWHNLVTAWERFDALWFLRIATGGYVDGDGSAAFFPLYPLAIRALSPLLGGHPLAAALVLSNLAFLGALVVVYLLTAGEHGEPAARRAVVLLAVFPSAYFFLAPYSEAPFLLLAAGSFLAARRGRWEVAGVAGALASATRSIGLLLPVALSVEALLQRREGRAGLARPLLWSAVAASGGLAYLLWWGWTSGDPLVPLRQQATWERELAWPWVTAWQATRFAFAFPGEYPTGYHLLDWVIAAAAVAAGVWVALRARASFAVYAWLSLLVPLALPFAGRPFMSLPRFLLPVFPLVWAPAVAAGARPWLLPALVGASAGLLGLMTALFAGWYYAF